MNLGRIIKGSSVEEVRGDRNREISSICCDSRKAAPGALFLAVKGVDRDGHA